MTADLTLIRAWTAAKERLKAAGVDGPVIDARLLVEAVGPAVAKDLLFSGRSVAPQEALAIGLVSRVCPAAELSQAVGAEARLWATLSPGSIRGAKQAVRATLDRDVAQMRALVEGFD